MSATKEREMTVATVDPSRRMANLQIANEVRFGIADVKRELASGALSVAAALEDPRAQPMEISVLLCALPRWGDVRVGKLLGPLMISEWRRVRDIPDRQRRMVVGRVAR